MVEQQIWASKELAKIKHWLEIVHSLKKSIKSFLTYATYSAISQVFRNVRLSKHIYIPVFAVIMHMHKFKPQIHFSKYASTTKTEIMPIWLENSVRMIIFLNCGERNIYLSSPISQQINC